MIREITAENITKQECDLIADTIDWNQNLGGPTEYIPDMIQQLNELGFIIILNATN